MWSAFAMTVDFSALALELIKLLWEMAWSDGHLADEEKERVRTIAREVGGPPLTEEVESWIDGRNTPGPPDMAFLKSHKDLVMREIGKMALADRMILDDEKDFARVVAELLNR
jgi:uncharacterized tellurite resistance protein B-like protein